MPYINLDGTDLRILTALQADGRLTNTELADQVGLSQSPCLRRVRRLEQDGFIRSYRAVLDREAVGLSLTVFVEFKLETSSQVASEMLQRDLLTLPQVVTCHMLSGDVDCLAEIVVPSVKAFETFLNTQLRSLPNVRNIRSNIALKRVKSEMPMPLTHLHRDGAAAPTNDPDGA